MKHIAHRRPRLKNKRRSDEISTLKITLREHYRRRRTELGLNIPKQWDEDLKAIFAFQPSRPEASRFISSIRSEVTRKVAQGLGQHQYHIDQLVRKIERRAGELQLNVHRPKRQVKQDFLDLLTGQTLDYISKGKHRILM